jgi:hypothetical protein
MPGRISSTGIGPGTAATADWPAPAGTVEFVDGVCGAAAVNTPNPITIARVAGIRRSRMFASIIREKCLLVKEKWAILVDTPAHVWYRFQAQWLVKCPSFRRFAI